MQEAAARLLEDIPNNRVMPGKQAMPKKPQTQMSWCPCQLAWIKRDPTLPWRSEDLQAYTDQFNEAFPPVGVQSGIRSLCDCKRSAPYKAREAYEVKRRRGQLTKGPSKTQK